MAVNRQYTLDIQKRRDEDDCDVKFIIKNFLNDGYTTERLQQCLTNEKRTAQLSVKKYGTAYRGNLNVIRAIELMLSTSFQTSTLNRIK